jgi:hypothetical protein
VLEVIEALATKARPAMPGEAPTTDFISSLTNLQFPVFIYLRFMSCFPILTAFSSYPHPWRHFFL